MQLRQLAFNVTAAVAANLLRANEWLTTFLASLFIGVNALIRSFFATLSVKFMTWLDPASMKSYETQMKIMAQVESQPPEVSAMNIELKLLDAGYKVRNHARESGDWTDHHTEALEALGDALLNECGWDEPRVHEKLKEIVESIDGLQYGPD